MLAAELGLPEPEETGASFAENAELKARAAALASGLVALDWPYKVHLVLGMTIFLLFLGGLWLRSSWARSPPAPTSS